MTDLSIRLKTADITAEIWPLGARLNQLTYQDRACLVAAADHEEALTSKRYNGAVVGPIANRVAGGTLEIEGTRYAMPRNEAGITTLHSGPDGLHARNWTLSKATETSAQLQTSLSDGEIGLPGRRELTVIYQLDGSTLSVVFEAKTDRTTCMNLALHPYWSLGQPTREALQIRVHAKAYTPVNAEKIPTGDIADVTGTIFDLREMTAPDPKIDHNFCFENGADQPILTLKSPDIQMALETDAPGVQIYAGKPDGIAIEPQHWPDAPHHEAFPSILLEPGATYRQKTTYRFSRANS